MAQDLTIREAMILAYLTTIAAPPGMEPPVTNVVSRHYLSEKLRWIHSTLQSTETDMFANLDPDRERVALKILAEWGFDDETIRKARGPRTWAYELGNTKFITHDGEKP